MSDGKTLGQVAYEAHCNGSNHAYHMTADEWANLWPDHKAAWEAAAEAAVASHEKAKWTGWERFQKTPKQKAIVAVVEAAEDATVSGDLGRVLIRLGLVPGLEEPVKRIIRAVEALQEAADE